VFHRTQCSPSVEPPGFIRGDRRRVFLTPGSNVASRLRSALFGLLAVFSACTLSDDFNPASVDQLPNRAADAGALPSACPGGVECCASAPCGAGERCREGTCEATQLVVSVGDAGGCRGTECPLPDNLSPPRPSCDDGVTDPGETDRDCGGVCGGTCQVDQRCAVNGDCNSGLVCAPATSRCAVATCIDGLHNGAEVLADCGGGVCPGCPDGTACSAASDCQSGVCGANGRCAAPSCTDGVKNGTEGDTDCGGNCANCATGRGCAGADDCQSAVCAATGCGPGLASCCQAATCTDGVRNTNESDVDCGGRCPDCIPGRACVAAADCQSGVCAVGGCGPGALRCCQAPSCDDGVVNGGEIDVDCGAACGLCPLTAQCTEDAQCQSGFCPAGSCVDPGTCNDGARNGTESATDCGGDRCPRCADRLTCTQASDCNNNNCFNGVCISCGSGVKDGTETGIDCGGADPFCRRCNPGEACLIGSDCVAGVCFNGFC
jgi:hypothetical protein